ncbi:nesprin-1-like isoform X2 [Thalassophryne amazonica]|nr:nesprin-1-like isoform X2 [Thalassophryne amazonica]
MQAEIYLERESLESRRNEIINTQLKLEAIKLKVKSEQSKETETPSKKVTQEQGLKSLQSLILKNNNILSKAKQAKEQMEINMADIKVKLDGKRDMILRNKSELEDIKEKVNANIKNMKQRWNKMKDVQIQKYRVETVEGRKRQIQEKVGFDTAKGERPDEKIKMMLRRIKEQMEKLWDETDRGMERIVRESEMFQEMKAEMQRQKQDVEDRLVRVQSEGNDIERRKIEMQAEREMIERERRAAQAEVDEVIRMRESIERQKGELDDKLRSTKKEIRELEVTNSELEIKKKNLEKLIRMSKRTKEKQKSTEHILEFNVNAQVQRVILEIKDICKMLCLFKEVAEQSKDFKEQKSQIKWMKFQVQKKQRQLDIQTGKVVKERDDLEILKIKMQRQSEELRQKTTETVTKIQIMGEIKATVEKAVLEMKNSTEEMHETQRRIEENKEKIQNCMDKLLSMKAQVSECIWEESAIRKSISLKKGKHQEPQYELSGNFLEEETCQIAKETTGFGAQHQSKDTKRQQVLGESMWQEGEVKYFIKMKAEKLFFQQQTEVEKETLMDNDQKENEVNVGENNEMLNQMSTLKEEEEKTKDQIQKAVENMEQQHQEIQKLAEINELQSQRGDNEIYSQNTMKPLGNLEHGRSELVKKVEHTGILKEDNDNLEGEKEFFKFELQEKKDANEKTAKMVKSNEFDLVRLNDERPQTEETTAKWVKTERHEIKQAKAEGIGGDHGRRCTKSADIQKPIEQIYRTKQTIQVIKLKAENLNEEQNIKRYHQNGDAIEIPSMLQEMKRFGQVLKMVRDEMKQREMDLMSQIKWMKTAARKQKRQLDQRLEKTLRERDELDISKVKIQRREEAIEQKLLDIATVKSNIEKIFAKRRKKSEDFEMAIKETKVKLRQLEDLKDKFETRKQDPTKGEASQRDRNQSMSKMNKKEDKMEKSHDKLEAEMLEDDIKPVMECLDFQNSEINLKKQSEDTEHLKSRTMTERKESETLKRQIQVERENLKRARYQAEAEINKMNCLREQLKRQKQEVDEKTEKTKREIKEMELLKSELEMKRRESELTVRKAVRKKAELEIMWNEIQKEKESLRKETNKRERQLDQRLERTMRERDETEIMKIKLQRQKEALEEEMEAFDGKKKSTKTSVLRKGKEEFQITAKEETQQVVHNYDGAVKYVPQQQSQWKTDTDREKEMINREQTSKNNQVTNIGDEAKVRKLHAFISNLQNGTRKIHVHLEKFKMEMENMEKAKVLLEEQKERFKALKAENTTARDAARRLKCLVNDETENFNMQAQEEKKQLETALEQVKLERSELEVLKSELEVKKKENQRVVRNGERQARKMWTEIKMEKDALKRKMKKKQKELEQRLWRIIRERDELEIIKLKLQKENSKVGTTETNTSAASVEVSTPVQKLQEQMKACISKYQLMRSHINDINRVTEKEKQHLIAEARLIAQAREEVENNKMEMNNQKEKIICVLKNMQQMQTHLQQMEIKVKNEQKLLDEEKERLVQKSELVVQRKEVRKEKDEEWKGKVDQHKLKKQHRETKKVKRNNESEVKIRKSKKQMQTHATDVISTQPGNLQQQKEEQVEQRLGILEEQICKEGRNEDLLEAEMKLNVAADDRSNENKRQDLDAAIQSVTKEKLDLDAMRSDILKVLKILERYIQDMKVRNSKLEITQPELQKQREHLVSVFDDIKIGKIKINDLIVQVETGRNQLQTIVSRATLKKSERDLEEDNVKGEKQDVEGKKDWVLLREELEKKKEEHEAAMDSVSEQSQQLKQMEAKNESEKETFFRESEKIILIEDHGSETKSMETRRTKFRQLIERTHEGIQHKIKTLAQNNDVIKICTLIKQNHADIDKVAGNIKALGSENGALLNLMSDRQVHRQEMEVQFMQRRMREKQNLEILKAGITREREDLNRKKELMNKEKLHMNDIQKQMNTLQQHHQRLLRCLEFTKADLQNKAESAGHLLCELNTSKTSVKDLTVQVHLHRDQLEKAIHIMVKKENEQKLNNENLTGQTQELQKGKSSVQTEKQTENLKHLIERTQKEIKVKLIKLEQNNENLQSLCTALKKTQAECDQKRYTIQEYVQLQKDLNIQVWKQKEELGNTIKIKNLKKATCSEIKHKLNSLEQNNEAVQKISGILQKTQAQLDDETEIKIPHNTEMLRHEIQSLRNSLSDYVTCRKEEESQRNKELFLEKEYLLDLKAELNEMKNDLDRKTENMTKDKVALNLLKSDIQKQINTLEHHKHEADKEKEILEITKTELQNKTEDAQSLFDEIHIEKNSLKDLAMQVQNEKEQLHNLMSIISLNKKEQMQKDDDLNRQRQELEHNRSTVLAEREELEQLKKDFNKRKEEVEAAMENIIDQREQLNHMKSHIDNDREMLHNDKDKMEADLSELRMREDLLNSNIQGIETLTAKLKESNRKRHEDIIMKTLRLKQNQEDVQTLCLSLEEKCAELDQERNKIPHFIGLLQREMEGLIIYSDKTNQWQQKLQAEKQDFEKLKTELKDEKEDHDKEGERMMKEKLDLEQMTFDIQKQTDILTQLKQDTKKEMEMLEFTKTEVNNKTEHADSLFEEINEEKSNLKDLAMQIQNEKEQLHNLMSIISLKEKEQMQKDDELNRQTQEVEHNRSIVLAEREDLEQLKTDLNKRKEEVEAAMENITEQREQLNHMKSHIDDDREMLHQEKNKMEADLSELRMREDLLNSNVQTIESLRAKLKGSNQKRHENIIMKTRRLKQNQEEVQTLCLSLEEKCAELDQERNKIPHLIGLLQREMEGLIIYSDKTNQWQQKLLVEKQDFEKMNTELKDEKEDHDKEAERMMKEKLDLEQMRFDIQKQTDILKQLKQDTKKEMEMLEFTKTEIKNKTEYADNMFEEINEEKSNLKDLVMQVQNEKEQLHNLMSIISLNEKEQMQKDDDLNRQRQELEHNRSTVLAEREELEKLRKDFNKRKEEVEAAMENITEQREQLNHMKSHIDNDREMLHQEKNKMEADLSELRMREDLLNSNIQGIETLTAKLKESNRKRHEDIIMKTLRLKQNQEDVQKLCLSLEEKCAELDQERNKIPHFIGLLQREMEGLIIYSDKTNQWQQKLQAEKQDFEKLKTELKDEKEDHDKEGERKEKEQMQKDDELNRQTQEVEHNRSIVLAEREDLEQLKTDLNKRKEEVEAAMENITEQREQLNHMKSHIDDDREMLHQEKNKMEADLSELRMREDLLNSNVQTIESLRAKLKGSNQKRHENIIMKTRRLKQNQEEVQTLCLSLEEKCAELDQERNKIPHLIGLLQREMEGLIIYSDKTNQWQQKLLVEKQDFEKMNTELKDEKEDHDKEAERMMKEKLDLEQMRFDIQKQTDILKQLKQDTKKEMEMLEFTKTEIKNKTEYADNMFEEINEEKSNLKDLVMQVQNEKEQLHNLMSIISLKEKEQMQKDDELNRQTQEVEHNRSIVLAEREDLEQLKTDLNKRKEEVEAAMENITEQREQLNHMKSHIDNDREMLHQEKNKMEADLSELRMREDLLNSNVQTIESLRAKLKESNQKRHENIIMKTRRLKQNQEEVQTLCLSLEEKCAELDQERNKIPHLIGLLQREMEGLIIYSDKTNQWQQKLLVEKQDFEKMNTELKDEKEDHDKEAERMMKEKLDLEQMRFDIQKQTDILKQLKQDTKKEMEMLEFTKTEIKNKTEYADSMFEEINEEKSNLKDLVMQVQNEKEQLHNLMSIISLNEKEQMQKDDELNRQTQEVEHNRSTVLAEREELEKLRKDFNKRKEEVEAAMENITEQREQLNHMKSHIDNDREMLQNDKDKMEADLSELRMREDLLNSNVQTIESLRAKLKESNQKRHENIIMKTRRLEQNQEEVQTLCLSLEEKCAELDQERNKIPHLIGLLQREMEGLIIYSDKTNQWQQKRLAEKQDFEKMNTEVKDEKEDHDKEAERKEKEQMQKDDELNRQTQEVEHNRSIVLAEREDLEQLKKDLNKRKEEVEAEKNKMEADLSELRMREDLLNSNVQTIESLRAKLKESNQKRHEDIIMKTRRLEQNQEDVQTLCLSLEEKCAELDQERNKIPHFIGLLQREMEGLIIYSDKTNKWQQKLLVEKQDFEKLNTELKDEKEDHDKEAERMMKEKLDLEQMRFDIQKQTDILKQLKQDTKKEMEMLEFTKTEVNNKTEHADSMFEEINEEKSNLKDLAMQIQNEKEQLHNLMSIISLKEKEHIQMDDELNRQTQEVEHNRSIVLAEREDLQQLKKDFKKKKEEVEAAMENIIDQRQQLNHMKSHIDNDREMLHQEKNKMEADLSELRMREDLLNSNVQTIESLRAKLKESNQKRHENIIMKTRRLKQNQEEVQTLCLSLEEKCAEPDQESNKIPHFIGLLQREMEGLIIYSDKTNQWHQKLLAEKQDFEKMNTELKDEKEDHDKEAERMMKEKLDLEQMRFDIQKQTDILKQLKQDTKKEMEMLEFTKTELKNKTENADSLFEEINEEKSNLKDLAMQVQNEKEQFHNLMSIISLKEKEQMQKDDDLNRQTQEVEHNRSIVLAEREDLEQLKTDLNKRKEEVEAAMENITEQREQLNHMKSHIDNDREMLHNDKDKMEADLSELRMREDLLNSNIQTIETLTAKLKESNQKRHEDIIMKTQRLEQNQEDVQTLCLSLEEKCAELDQERNKIPHLIGLLQREMEGLIIYSDKTNQWQQKLLVEKQDFDILKTELKEEKEDHDKEPERMMKEKLDLEQMRSDIQKQTDILKQLKQDTKKEMEMLEFTKTEIKNKTEYADSMFEEINEEKSNLKDLAMQVQNEKEQLHNLMSIIFLKENEQMTMDDELKRQRQELEHNRSIVLAEREELEQLKKDFNKRKEEVEAAMENIIEQREKLNHMKSHIDNDREMLQNDKDKMEADLSELRMREDLLNSNIQGIETLTAKLKESNRKRHENIILKTSGLKQNQEDVQKLCLSLEEKCAELDQERNKIRYFIGLLQREMEGLIIYSDKTNQWQKKLLVEKQDFEKLNIELKEEKEDHDKEAERKEKEQMQKDDELNRQTQEVEHNRSTVLAEREELEKLRKDFNKRKEEVEAEKNKMESDLSELRMREDLLNSNIQTIESLRAKLKESNQKRHEDIIMKTRRLEQNQEDVQTLCLSLEEKCAELDQERNKIPHFIGLLQREMEGLIIYSDKTNQWQQKLLVEKQDFDILKTELKEEKEGHDKEAERMMKEKLDLEQTRFDSKKQTDILKQLKQDTKKEMEKLEFTKTELNNKTVHADSLFEEINAEKSNLKDLAMQLQNEKEQLHNLMSIISLNEKEQMQMDDELKRQTQEVEHNRSIVLAEREELEQLKKDFNKRKEEVEAEKNKMEADLSELRMREDQLKRNIQTIETLTAKLKEMNQKRHEDIITKTLRLKQNQEDVQKLCLSLKQKCAELDQDTNQRTDFIELIRSGHSLLLNLSSLTNKWQHKFLLEKQDLEKLMTDLMEERADLQNVTERTKKEKMDLEQIHSDIQKQIDMLKQQQEETKKEKEMLEFTKTELKNKTEHAHSLFKMINEEKSSLKDLAKQVQNEKGHLQKLMGIISLKEHEQMQKDDELNRQIQEVEQNRSIVLAEREHLEHLKKDLNKKKAEVEAAIENIIEQREQLNHMKSRIDNDRQMLKNEKDKMEADLSEVKMREDLLNSNIQTIETLTRKLKEMNLKRHEDFKLKLERLEQKNEYVQKLCHSLEPRTTHLHQQRNKIFNLTYMIQKEKKGLADVTHQWQRNSLLEKHDFEKLKTNLKEEQEELSKIAEQMNKEKMDLMLKKAGIRNIWNQLERAEHDLAKGKHILETAMTKMQNMRIHTDTLLDVTKTERKNIQSLSFQIQREKHQLENALKGTALKQIQQLKYSNRQTEEVKKITSTVLAVQTELQLFKKDMNMKTEEVGATMKSLSINKEQTSQMKIDISKDREMLLNRKHNIRRKITEFIIRENQLLCETENMTTLRERFTALIERTGSDIKNKMCKLEVNNEDFQKLCILFQQKQRELDQVIDTSPSYIEMFQQQMQVLKSVASDMVLHREDMKNHMKLEIETLQKLKGDLKQQRGDLDRTIAMTAQEKLNLQLISSGIQHLTDKLEQLRQEINREKERLEFTIVELQNKTDYADSLFDEIKMQKYNIAVLAMQVDNKREELNHGINLMMLKEKEQQIKDEEIRNQMQELQNNRSIIFTEKEDLELLSKDLKSKKEEVETAMDGVSVQRKELNQIMISIQNDRQILQNEKYQMEACLYDLKSKKDQLIADIMSVKISTMKLQQVPKRVYETIRLKTERLERNSEHVQKVCLALQQNLAGFDQERNKISHLTDVVQREKSNLICIMSGIAVQKEGMESNLQQNLLSEQHSLRKLKDELKNEREELNRWTEMMTNEKLSLDLMRSDIQKQSEIVDHDEKYIREEKYRLATAKTEIQNKMEHANTLFDQVNREKNKITDLTIQLQAKRDHLQRVMDVIVFKELQQESTEDKLKKQTQELHTCSDIIHAQREEVELLRNDFNKHKGEFENARDSMRNDKEQLSQMKVNTEMDRQMLEHEKYNIQGQLSELRMREDKLMSKTVHMENLRVKLKQMNATICKDIKIKMDILQQNQKNVQNSCSALEGYLGDLNQKTEKVPFFTERIKQEKDGLRGILSEMSIQKTRMENQWQQKPLLEKQDIDKIKAELEQERKDLDRANEMINKEKLNLGLIRSDIQKQSQIIEQYKKDIKKEKDLLGIAKKEIDNKKDNLSHLFEEIHREKASMKHLADCLFDEIKSDKSKMKDLAFQVQKEKEQLQNIVSTFVLKQKQKEWTETKIIKQAQNLRSNMSVLLAQREELNMLKKDLKITNQEIKAAVDIIGGEREQLQSVKNRMDESRKILEDKKKTMNEQPDLRVTDDQLMIGSEQTQQLRGYLKEAVQRTCDTIQRKMGQIEENNQQVKKVYDVLEQNQVELIEKKANVSCYNELLECEKERLMSLMSEEMQNQSMTKSALEKQDLEELKAKTLQQSKYLNRVREIFTKEKIHFDSLHSSIQKQTEMLEWVKEQVSEEKEKWYTAKTELQTQKESTNRLLVEIQREKKLLHDLKANIETGRRVLLNNQKGMEEELVELKMKYLHLQRALKSMRTKLTQLNQKTREDMRTNLEGLDQKNRHIHHLNTILQETCDEFKKQIFEIKSYHDLIQREKHVVTMTSDKEVQTKGWEQEHEVDALQKVTSDVTIQTEEVESQFTSVVDQHDLGRNINQNTKTMREGLPTVVKDKEVENDWKEFMPSTSVEDQVDSTDGKISKRHYLRKMWKDTKLERQEIDHMKRRGHQIRNNLQNKLKVINQFVKTSWLNKEKEKLEHKKLEQGLSKDKNPSSTSERETEYNIQDDKYAEFEQLRVEVLSEIDKLTVKEKGSKTVQTCDKANQTFQTDARTGDAIVQVTEEKASTELYQEQMNVEGVAKRSSGLLGHFLHYCNRCCSPCCACCRQTCQEQ